MTLSKCVDTNKLKSLRRIFVGGSCATDGMQQQLYAKLSPNARIAQVYGMTEAGWATIWQNREKDITGSVGRPLPGSQLRSASRRADPRFEGPLLIVNIADWLTETAELLRKMA
jgi:acyl-coenzyme A synthetase/AMP-(fatty) acid ligase